MDTAKSTTAPDTAAAPAAAVKPRKPVVITLNHSLDFATVHGERSPDDRDHMLCFVQDGLPFDAQERLMENHPSVTGDPKAKAKVEKLRRRAEKLLEKAASREEDDDEGEIDEETDGIDSGEGPIDLKKWAMGTVRYRWQLVSDAIVLKIGRRVTSKRDALETLIAEGIVQPGQLSPEHKLALQRL